MAEPTQYHITLRFPVAVKFSGIPFPVKCFDATLTDDPVNRLAEIDAQAREFRVVRVWDNTLKDSRKITLTLFVPSDNIAGLVAQPFERVG